MKRIISLVLTMVMLLGVVFSASFTVSAAATKASDECIELLKQYEGFVQYPYQDYGQWTVGYGTKCPDDKLADYEENGITEEEAEALLRAYVASYEEDLQYFANHYGLSLTQNEFDAMFLFTYNCGSGWIFNTTTNFHKTMAKENPDADDIIYAFGTWSNAGNAPLTGLIYRRMAEANLYLNGVYSKSRPANYSYVIYDANGGTIVDRVHVFNVNSKNLEPITPTLTGNSFEGWYTEKTGGTKVTALAASLDGKTLYARWSEVKDETVVTPGGDGGEEYVDVDLPVAVKVTSDGVNMRKGPGTNYTSTGFANYGTRLTLTKVSRDDQGRLWGCSSEGWICLQYTNYESVIGGVDAPEDTEDDDLEIEEGESRTGVVTAQGWLNIRKGAGTNQQVVGTYKTGAEIEILEIKVVGSAIWGRTEDGWVSMTYVKLDEVEEPEKPATKPDDDKEEDKEDSVVNETVPVTGTVNIRNFGGGNRPGQNNNNTLTIYKEASTTSQSVGSYKNGDRVEILEQKKTGSSWNATNWGRTDKGWINLASVSLDNNNIVDINPDEMRVIKDTTELNIRKDAGTEFDVVGSYKVGDVFKVIAKKTVGSITWGKTDKGWINLAYTELDTSITPVTGSIKVIGNLNIRKEAAANAEVVGTYKHGDKVTITNEKKVGTTTWGKTDKGWIDMSYVVLDESEIVAPPSSDTGSTPAVGTGTVKVSGVLNIRTGAGTNFSICGAYYNGTKVTILEKKTIGSTTWGKTDKGWISMTYVVLDAQGSTGTTTPAPAPTPTPSNETGVVNVSSILNIRTGAGTGYSTCGYYNKGTRVTILETKVVGSTTWGRTDKGWVSMDYIIMGSNSDSTSTGTTRTITASCLKIRKAAGTSNAVVGYLYKGAKVSILETKTVGNEVWGRIDKGWIALAYTA